MAPPKQPENPKPKPKNPKPNPKNPKLIDASKATNATHAAATGAATLPNVDEPDTADYADEDDFDGFEDEADGLDLDQLSDDSHSPPLVDVADDEDEVEVYYLPSEGAEDVELAKHADGVGMDEAEADANVNADDNAMWAEDKV